MMNDPETKELNPEDTFSEKDDVQSQEEGEQSTKSKRKRKRKRKSKSLSADSAGDQSSETPAAAQDKLNSLDLTVYVEGIPFDCSDDDVKRFFSSNGCVDILEVRLPRWQDSGRLRGYGHVVFDTKESRERAVTELSGQHLGGRYLTIQQPKKPREDTTQGAASQRTAREQPEDCKVVYVKNLPYDASEQDIWDTFHVCGKIVEGGVRIARNYQTQQSKGFAYIEFKNPEGAYSAVQKAAKPYGMTVHGRPCFVDYDEGAMKGSYKTKEGRLWTREYGKKPTTTTTNKRPRPTL